jgi:hypothetical protein
MEGSFRLEYYNTRVREDIEDWPLDLLARCDELLDLLEDHGPQLGPPHSKAMGVGRAITVLHIFAKKTQKTPRREFHIARERLRNVKRHA